MRKKLSPNPLPYIAQSAGPNQYQRHGYNPVTDIIVGFNRRKSTFLEKEEMNMAPDPEGISGCELWRLEQTMVLPQEARIHLAAIMTEHYAKHNFVLGTNMGVVRQLLLRLAELPV